MMNQSKSVVLSVLYGFGTVENGKYNARFPTDKPWRGTLNREWP